jgi:hypothetical protein
MIQMGEGSAAIGYAGPGGNRSITFVLIAADVAIWVAAGAMLASYGF